MYNFIAYKKGYSNHFDYLPNDIIEKILQNMYPLEVYDSKLFYKYKKSLLEELKKIQIKVSSQYNSLSIKHKLKYNKKYNKQYYLKPELIKNLGISDKKVKKSSIVKILKKQNKLLLNPICNNYNKYVYLNKCFCGLYCNNPIQRWDYTRYNNISYFTYRFKDNHNSRLCKIIQNENKCLKYGDNICYCNTCDKYIKKSSVKSHLESEFHLNSTLKYKFDLVLNELKNNLIN